MVTIVLFGLYSLFSVLYGVFTFRDCPEEAEALRKVGTCPFPGRDCSRATCAIGSADTLPGALGLTPMFTSQVSPTMHRIISYFDTASLRLTDELCHMRRTLQQRGLT